MSFADYAAAAKVQQLIEETATNIVNKLRPRARYGRVHSFIPGGKKINVLLNGDISPVTVNLGTITPLVPDQLVRVEGIGIDRYVGEVLEGPRNVHRGVSPFLLMPLSGASNYGQGHAGAAYAKTSAGIVVLQGLIVLSSNAATTIFTLPEDMRPSVNLIFKGVHGNNGAARIEVGSDGKVIVRALGFVTGFVSLAGIMFPAAGAVTWVPITGWQNGFGNYDPAWGIPSYGVDIHGRVWHQGLVSRAGGAAASGNVNMFSTPVPTPHDVHLAGIANDAFGNFDITPSGGGFVRVKTGTASTSWVSLANIYYASGSAYPTNSPNRFLNERFINSWARFSGSFPQAQMIAFPDGLIFSEGLIASGTVSTTGFSHWIPRELMPVGPSTYSLSPAWSGSLASGKQIFGVSAADAFGRSDVELPSSNSIEPAAPGYLQIIGSATWRTLGGINWYIG